MWRMPLRGGNWNNGANAGLAALNLNNDRGNSNTNIGARPALRYRRKARPTGCVVRVNEKERYSRLRTNRIMAPAASTHAGNVVGANSPMPKTHNNLWPAITSWENIYAAYREAAKRKRSTRQALRFTEGLEENIFQIQNELIWKTWEPQPHRTFVVHEPKQRSISAPIFYDRVVHHSLVRVIEPLFDRKFIDRSCACRPGRGTHHAVKSATRMIRASGVTHVLKGDVRSYFPSIQSDILKANIRRTIADRDALWLIDTIIGDGAGVPIGALTSQLFANIYLDPLDHYMTDELGVPYVRYMDDFIVTGGSRRELREVQEDARRFLRSLALEMNPKSDVIPVSHGVDFCGYRTFRHKRLPRKRNVKRARKRLQGIARAIARDESDIEAYKATMMSFLGYMKHCQGYHTTRSTLDAAAITHGRGA